MPDKKSKHKEERKRKKSREHSNEKEEKKSRHEKRDEERRSRHERRGKEEKDFDRKMKEEKESERRVKEDKESDRRVKEEKDSERRMKDERSTDKKRKEHEPERKDKEEDCEVGLGQERLSLSIEETNKMREKLGLKPLKVDNKTTDGKETNEDGVKKEKKEDVHKPAINMADLKKTAMLKEKLAQMKEKRKHEETFSRIRPIACEKEEEEEEEEDVDSVLKWVAKSRKIEEAKKKQEEEEKLSKEFGVDKLVKKEFGGDKKYSSRELRGMKIEHDLDRFKEGKNVVLTLKDKGVLEENDDVLVNVNMVDDEAAEENTENRKKKLDYNPYEDLEYDEHGNPREESILNKYDDEIRGGKLKKSFTIGTQPNASGNSEDSSKRHMQSLVLPKPLLVSEYYTAQELELSGKPRKVRAKKVRKRVKLRADDLLDEVKTEVPSEVKSEVKKEVKVEQEEVDEDWDPYTDLSGVVVEEDGVALELEMAIKKASRINAIKSRTSHTSSEALVSVKEEPEEMEGIEMDLKDGIVLNSTTEYCRSLGEVSVSVDPSQAMPMHEDEEEDEEKKEEDNMKGWQSVDMEEGEVPVKEEDTHVLDEEPILNKGVGAALMLASKKGYLNSSSSKAATARVTLNLEAKNYSIEDKRVEDDDKYRSKRDRYTGSGPVMPFREKDGYDPDIKLEYIDDLGREMSKKEAFRYLSHQFHGKGSGLKKCEKRMKKEKEDTGNRTITSELPLTTVQMLQEKQRHSKLPYVILAASKSKN